jgi:archaellum component FlaC
VAISERLSQTLHQQLGHEAGEDLVTWMVQMEDNRSGLREMMDGYMSRIDRQFEKIDMRFEKMDERFDKVDERLDRMDQRFDKVDARFEKVDLRFEQAHRDFASLETRVADHFTDLFKWSFVFWCGAVGAIALLARALR